MNKQELLDKVSELAKITKADASRALAAIFDIIKHAIAKVTLTGSKAAVSTSDMILSRIGNN